MQPVFFILAQLWQLATNGTLKNMAGPWKYGKKKLSIPKRGRRVKDFIKDKDTGYFLGRKIMSGKQLNELTFLGPTEGEF